MDIKKQIIETTEYKQKQDVSLYQDVCHIIEQGRERAYFRQFYLTINNKQILQTCLQNLTWSHILRALRVDDPIAIRWYLETASQEIDGNGTWFRIHGASAAGAHRHARLFHRPCIL